MTVIYFYLLFIFSGYLVSSTIITLGLYIWIMKWKKAGVTKENAEGWQKWMFALGVFCDAVYNYTSLTLIMLQFPRRGEVMATARFRRTVRQTGWRARIAKGYCWLLEQFDKGHCSN